MTDDEQRAELELQLAGMETKCPCDGLPTCWACELLEGKIVQYVPEKHTFEGAENHNETICSRCNGTGVVPLIAGSRRECKDCLGTGVMPLINGGNVCSKCQGHSWIPDLDGGMKVLAWMQSQNKLSEVAFRQAKEGISCQWYNPELIAVCVGATHPEALLRAAIAGATSMAQEVTG